MLRKLGLMAKDMLTSLLFILLATWLALVILVSLFQERLVYLPSKAQGLNPADIGLAYEDVYLKTEDSVKLHGWLIEHEAPTATLLFLHGNAGNIAHRLDSIYIFHQLGLSVFIIDYRGYGQSEGRPGEAGTYQDAQAAWDYLVKERRVPTDQIILFGRSLGGGVATWLASREPAAALIVESSFTSLVDVGRHHYPYLPVGLLARIRYPSIDRMQAIRCPVLIVHSPEDEIIPYRLGEALYQAAAEPKSFLQIQGGHNEGFFISGELYTNGLENFIADLKK